MAIEPFETKARRRKGSAAKALFAGEAKKVKEKLAFAGG
jgi:hypothetical protein